MDNISHLSIDNYSCVGDVAVIAICGVIITLLMSSYVSRTQSFSIFMGIIVMLVAAAAVNIAYHYMIDINAQSLYVQAYLLRLLYHALLFCVLFLFALYITVVTGLDHRKARFVAVVSCVLLVTIIGLDVIRTLRGIGFQITESGEVIHRANLFIIGYTIFVVLLLILMTRVGKLLYRRVVYGFYGTVLIALVVRFAQLPLNQSSLTTMTFVFPVIAMLYVIHSNPYNLALGTVDVRAMEELVGTMYAKKSQFIIMSLLLPDFNEEGKEFPEDIKAVIRQFALGYFRGCVVFQIGNGNVIMIAPIQRNMDYEDRFHVILADFHEVYDKFKVPYKIVFGESVDEISRKNEYASLIKQVQNNQPVNTIHRLCSTDVERFNRNEYILRELTDIFNKQDVNDPRVLVFCQPVFNLDSGRFDTAEALMRLKLEKTGMIFPDQFIPLAEKNGYIHVLTEIILNKTCREIKRMNDEGFRICRVSVNVSVLELKENDFCNDINRIIDDNDIQGESIAIELTESRTEDDFMIMKEKIDELRKRGIKFYLDDFGTGYSNMERIMELPFDIIKFDRSLVIASRSDERSEKIVDNLAHMFKEMDYSVLYEGVEDDVDEERCKEMSASYLQGYKYSRPVPIEQLRNFLPRSS